MARKSVRRNKIMEAQAGTRFDAALHNFASTVRHNNLSAVFKANIQTEKRIKELGVDVVKREGYRFASVRLSMQGSQAYVLWSNSHGTERTAVYVSKSGSKEDTKDHCIGGIGGDDNGEGMSGAWRGAAAMTYLTKANGDKVEIENKLIAAMNKGTEIAKIVIGCLKEIAAQEKADRDRAEAEKIDADYRDFSGAQVRVNETAGEHLSKIKRKLHLLENALPPSMQGMDFGTSEITNINVTRGLLSIIVSNERYSAQQRIEEFSKALKVLDNLTMDYLDKTIQGCSDRTVCERIGELKDALAKPPTAKAR